MPVLPVVVGLEPSCREARPEVEVEQLRDVCVSFSYNFILDVVHWTESSPIYDVKFLE